ncbi:hypothetical protein LO772_03905 [Yinghuangia sp. ASG 101]|uniref:hypothetical protein n=1 Tax=Yinghuangia sp. ASG 101 TaxID=2896848 RepID=UPI001E5DED10|nr:hypothetical protein [Yinghuangia sp. ASG 101]UGQ12776.1 hypothetical protein LO772_03905 [Yinghuangia sp. ASG 101]
MSDSTVIFRIEPLGDHEYLVAIHSGTETAEPQIRASPGIMRVLGAGEDDEERVVHETAEFLLAHQPLFDLPPMIDLEDVAAAYDDFLDILRKRLNG